jgi:5-methylcytosine-specific restriction endonuclease McrA
MDESVREFVRSRAGHRCEYCLLPQHVGASIRFHIEHIRSQQHGGNDQPDNLALACPNCNWNKGPNISGIDPETGAIVPLYNPRTDRWEQHFALLNIQIVGRTPFGRATVGLLRMNAPERLEVRQRLVQRGEFNV